MRQLRRSLTRRALHLLVMASFVASIFAAGRSYFFCRMLDEVQAHCCCTQHSKSDGNASIQSAGCCELRTHAAPGDASDPSVGTRIGAADLSVFLPASPVALIPRAVPTERAVLAGWTGPPPYQRRALISVRLL